MEIPDEILVIIVGILNYSNGVGVSPSDDSLATVESFFREYAELSSKYGGNPEIIMGFAVALGKAYQNVVGDDEG